MNHQDLRDAIFIRKPKYNIKFKPLMERISTKGDTSGKGDFSTFGAFYQTFMYAFIIGLPNIELETCASKGLYHHHSPQ